MSFAAQLIPYLSLLQRSLPEEASRSATRIIGKILASLQKARLRVAEKNLSLLGLEPLPQVAKRTIENWTISISDQLRSLWLSKSKLQGMVQDRWSHNLNQALLMKRGVVLLTAHLGNYELAGSYLASFDLPVYAVVEEIPGGHTKAVNRIRRRFGMGVVGYSDVPRMLKILRLRKILVLLADRDLEGTGVCVPFAEGIRRVPVGPALLALRTGASIQTGYFVWEKNRKSYRCVINPVLELKPEGSLKEKTVSITQAISAELVAAIRRYPDQWFVFQDE
jgi:lauroyl/myristoyl acyltransferase